MADRQPLVPALTGKLWAGVRAVGGGEWARVMVKAQEAGPPACLFTFTLLLSSCPETPPSMCVNNQKR